MITGAMPAPQTTPPTYHNPAPDHPQHDFAGALVAGQRRAVLHTFRDAVAFHAGQVQQHREPGRSFHQRADRGLVQPPIHE
jgi:hypothetical protein